MIKIGNKVKVIGIGKKDSHYPYRKELIGMVGIIVNIDKNGNFYRCQIEDVKNQKMEMYYFKQVKIKKWDDKKYKIIRVTSTEDYIIEMIDDKRTYINGWTMEEVIEDWFKGFSMGGHHASREGHVIGNSRKYISSEIVKLKEKKHE